MMTRARLLSLSVMVLVATLSFAGTAGAQDQTIGQLFTSFFSVATPGARANGMGRAFVGVADDASAAVTNPAGLMFLTRPQVYAEFKGSGYEQTDPFDILTFGAPSARLGYFAVSAPIGSRMSVAFSRHEFFGGDLKSNDTGEEINGRGTSYAGSIATTVYPNVKVGVTLSGGTLNFDGLGDSVSDSAFGFTAGALWQATEQVSVGVSGTKWSGSGDPDTFVAPSQIKFGVGLTPVAPLKVAVDVVTVYFPAGFADDQTDFHVGGEYQLAPVGMNRIFVRAGLYTGKESKFDSNADIKTETKVTGTFGGGVVVGQQLQLDFAVLTRKEVVISAAVRF